MASSLNMIISFMGQKETAVMSPTEPADQRHDPEQNKFAQSNLETGRVAAGCSSRGRCSTAP